MDSESALELSREAIFLLLKISVPLMLVALLVGLVISIFQALTQIQESTLSFAPKIIAVFISLILLFPFMGRELSVFMDQIVARIISGNG